MLERAIALVFSVVVGGTATFQLRNELPVHGLDAIVTKVLLALMILGCVLAFFAALNVIGGIRKLSTMTTTSRPARFRRLARASRRARV